MYYKFKQEKINEFKEGRTITALSEITGYSRQYLSQLLNGKCNATEESVKIILNKLKKYSIKVQILIDTLGTNMALEYFFEKTR